MDKIYSNYRDTLEKEVLSFVTDTVRLISGTGVESACLLTSSKNGHISIFNFNADGPELTAYAARLQHQAIIETIWECDFLKRKKEKHKISRSQPTDNVASIPRECLEELLLEKLRNGELDGNVGHDLIGPRTTSRLFIKDGIPYRIFFPTAIGPKPETIHVDRKFETDEGKLWFLRNWGFLMDDPDAHYYSVTYVRPGKP